MLTNSEKRWLHLRKLYAGVNHFSYYSCMHCPEYNVERWHKYQYPCNLACLYRGCPFIDIRSSEVIFDYVEAAEFEQRVVAKLADPSWAVCRHGDSCIEYDGDKQEQWIWNCEWCRLKYARIAVEEEMNANNK